MCDYVDYPPKYGHCFAMLCSIFIVSHILTDSYDFFIHILLCCFAGGEGIQRMAYFQHFHHKSLTKNILIVISFFMWIDANS